MSFGCLYYTLLALIDVHLTFEYKKHSLSAYTIAPRASPNHYSECMLMKLSYSYKNTRIAIRMVQILLPAHQYPKDQLTFATMKFLNIIFLVLAVLVVIIQAAPAEPKNVPQEVQSSQKPPSASHGEEYFNMAADNDGGLDDDSADAAFAKKGGYGRGFGGGGYGRGYGGVLYMHV
ncbi:hypothetical protein SeMB42_g02344 [Synchytrium endobioticum]|uniref:Uncharacterized protein n=2 Tax=Synchytrium endobioticum TaxID=286115 RepID=A0A507DFJ3_9FUNG|nr:hypothetical protein SeMB42_g02344 [Synchytrium endobioticum]